LARAYAPNLGRFLSEDPAFDGLNWYIYAANNPIRYIDPSGQFAITTFLITFAVTSFVAWAAGEILGHQLVGGAGSTVNGVAAITTGIQLFKFGPVGWAVGTAAILAGTAAIAFGSAEIQEHYTGNNWIKDTTGMSDTAYNWGYFGANIASTAASIGGNAYMKSPSGQAAYAKQNAETGITAPTNRSGLRNAMLKQGAKPFNDAQAHHGLPWEFRNWFAGKGLNVNNPNFGAWVKGGGNGGHQSWSKAYSNEWLKFMTRYPDASSVQISKFFNSIRTSMRWGGGF